MLAKLIDELSPRGEVTAQFAHDLRNPLAALTMNLEYAIAELAGRDEYESVREALCDCRDAGRTMSAMLSDAECGGRPPAGRGGSHVRFNVVEGGRGDGGTE